MLLAKHSTCPGCQGYVQGDANDEASKSAAIAAQTLSLWNQRLQGDADARLMRTSQQNEQRDHKRERRQQLKRPPGRRWQLPRCSWPAGSAGDRRPADGAASTNTRRDLGSAQCGGSPACHLLRWPEAAAFAWPCCRRGRGKCSRCCATLSFREADTKGQRGRQGTSGLRPQPRNYWILGASAARPWMPSFPMLRRKLQLESSLRGAIG